MGCTTWKSFQVYNAVLQPKGSEARESVSVLKFDGKLEPVNENEKH